MSKHEKTAPTLGRLQKWGSIALGLLFIVAGTSKVLDPWSFRVALPGYGITGELRFLVAILVPPLEVVLGIALVFRWRVRHASLAAMAFLGAFIVAIGVGWSRGTLTECGCFGAVLERSPLEATIIDVVFLVLAVVVWRGSPPVGKSRGQRNAEWQKSAILGGAGVCALVVTLLSLLAGASGVQATDVGKPDPEMSSVDLRRGRQLLYLFHHECPQCAKMSPRVVEYTQDPALPAVVGFTTRTTRPQIDAYRDLYGLRIPMQNLPHKQFSRITGEGSVPQLVFVRDGKVVRTWPSVFPDAGELKGLLTGD